MKRFTNLVLIMETHSSGRDSRERSLASLIRSPALLLALLLSLQGCVLPSTPTSSKEKPPPVERITMEISPAHQEIFVPFARELYERRNAIDPLLREMQTRGNDYCSLLHGQIPYSSVTVENFLKEPRRREFFKNRGEMFHQLMSGCWNFFEMNDFRPDRDFQLVRKLYPRKKFHCYSVGFLQPYIMNNILSCETLSMVDVDWRIIDGHWRLLHMMEEKRFQRSETLADALSELEVGWIAYRPPLQARVHADISLFCQDIQKEFCSQVFPRAESNIRKPRAISLQLSFLHTARYKSMEQDSLRVVFLSNAIEDMYTSPEQFRKLLERNSATLRPGQKTVLIHHVGGWSLFGLYELTRKEKGFKLRTLCRDRYLSRMRGGESGEAVEYTTHFEKWTKQEGGSEAPGCRELILARK